MEVWPLLISHSQGKLSYAEGVKLFYYFNPTSPLNEFYKVEDRYSRRQLKTFLDSKFEYFSRNQQNNSFKSFGESKFGSRKINLELLPEHLRRDYAELSPLIRKISSLHARLFNCLTDKDRYKICLEMYPLIKQRRGIFTRIDNYVATGMDVFLKPDETETLKKKPEASINYEVEYELKKLRVQRSKLKENPRRVIEYNQVCEKIKELTAKRYL